MIMVSDKPFDTGTINEYAERSIERMILNKMSLSEEQYVFDTASQLKFELRLRKEIINASYQLSKSRMSFQVFRKSKCNEQYWNRTDEGGFVLKEGVKASEAINDIFRNGFKYGTECATAMIIIYYKALLSVFPREVFDSLFSQIHLMNWHYLDSLIQEAGYMRKPKEYLPGDRRYFINPDVDPLTPYWQGENVIDLNNGLYYGHGIGIHKAETIIAVLNQKRKEGAEVSAYLLETVGRPDFKKLEAVYNQSVR